MKKATKTRTSKTGKSHTVIAYNTVGDMANDVRSVLKSVISQDDKYSTREATVISKLYNSELTRMKLQVEVHKISHKTNNNEPVTEVLSLS